MHQNQSWFAGVDWASQKHDVWLADASGKRLGKRTFEHSGEGLAQMCDWLIATSGGKPEDIHVAIEVPHGPVVETLLDRGFKVYAINPKQLDRFRDRFSPAGAKDDSRDAETLSSSLRTDRRAFHQVALADPAIIQLREWSRMADDLSADKIRHANRLREQLQRYYPQMLQFGSDLAEEWVLRLWEVAPTPAKAARLREAQVEKLLKSHRIRRIGAAEVLAILKQPALTVAPGVTEAAVAHIRVLIESIRLSAGQLKEVHRQLDKLCGLLAEPLPSEGGEIAPEQEQVQRTVAILQSLPGVGRIVLAVLLAEASGVLQRADYAILRILCGVAPVTRCSGKSRIVTRRLACNPRLRNAIHYLADAARRCDAKSKAKYLALRARGCSHARALRTIGDRLLYVACSMLKNGTPFDPSFESQKCA
ncbi:MAG: IS110 family transposase [Bryobacteraceae bacterium]